MDADVPSPQRPRVPGDSHQAKWPCRPPRGPAGGEASGEQLGLDTGGYLVRNYLIPVETNSIWYVIGGVLPSPLAFEIGGRASACSCLQGRLLLALRSLPYSEDVVV